MQSFFEIIGNIAVYLTAVSAILYGLVFKNHGETFKVFTGYVILISIIQLSAYFIGRGWLHRPNLFLSHFYFIIQFVFLSWFYFKLLNFNFIKYLVPILLLFVTYQFLTEPGLFYEYNAIGITISQTILVLYSILYFYKSLNGRGHFMIINIGIFLYLLPSTMIFASGNLVLDLDITKETRLILVNVNRILTLIFQVLIFIEWYRNFRPKQIKR